MRRGTIFLILFVIIAAAIVGVGLFLQNQPPIEITIAVDPLADDWAQQAASDFNASDTRINGTRTVRINILSASDLNVWRAGSSSGVNWSTQNHPHGWLPATSDSVEYTNFSFDIVTPSTARTLLVWAGFSSRVDALTENGNLPFDWDRVVAAAETGDWASLGGSPSWQFVRVAIPQPESTIEGVATLLSAAGDFNNTTTLTADNLRGDFYDWMMPFVGDPLQRFTGDVVSFMASRGPGAVSVAIAPESMWLSNLSGVQRNETVIFSYPEYNYIFDFPLAVWSDAETTADERAAVEAFGDWLLQSAQQQSTIQFGLRPANGNPTGTDQPFAEAQQYGILLTPVLDQSIQPPSLNDVQGLLAWYERERS